LSGKRTLSAALILLGLAGCAGDRKDVKAADLPAPVQATLEREAQGGKVNTIVQEKTTAGTTYRADVDATNGKKWDIVIDGAGKLVYKHTK
jgi:hypothetical protein